MKYNTASKFSRDKTVGKIATQQVSLTVLKEVG